MTQTARSPFAADAVKGSALSRYEKIFLVAGIAVAHGFLVHVWLYPSGSDAVGYVLAARDIAADGLFSKFYGSHVRTYGYPIFLVLVRSLADALRLPFQILLLETQLLLYVGAAFLMRRELIERYPTAARVVFCGLLANYYALSYACESLSESLSLTFALLAAACWLRMSQQRNLGVMLFVGSLIVGAAVMIRPANLFLVAAWVVGCSFLWMHRNVSLSRSIFVATAMSIAMLLPAIPQIINNSIHYGIPTPLVTYELGRLQHLWGVKYLKYATAMPPVPQSSIFYDNPLFEGTSVDSERPLQWYLNYPARGLATLTLHAFNLTDQDLTFTYARDLDPWYRRPLGLINHAIVALGLFGLVLLFWRVRTARDRTTKHAFLTLAFLLAANVAIYSIAAVEMRFGLTLLLALFPLAGYAIVVAAPSHSARIRVAMIGFTVAYAGAALLLSDWVRSQSLPIREAVAARRALEASLIPNCPAIYDFATPARGEGWSVPERNPDGSYSMWMASRHASLELPTSCGGAAIITMGVSGYMADDILAGLSLRVDGHPIGLEINHKPDGSYLIGSLHLRPGAKSLLLEIEAPRVIIPAGGNRTLAVMFNGLSLKPKSD